MKVAAGFGDLPSYLLDSFSLVAVLHRCYIYYVFTSATMLQLKDSLSPALVMIHPSLHLTSSRSYVQIVIVHSSYAYYIHLIPVTLQDSE